MSSAFRAAVSILLAAACRGADGRGAVQDAPAVERARMVAEQIQARGVRDARVLAAMRDVPRHRFVPASQEAEAYQDRPLSIGHGQTISQPYIVALMTELVRPQPVDRALEIGTGSGYQAAILSRLAAHVYTIEIVEPLARDAEQRLKTLGYANVTVRAGDGYAGWPDAAPFDIIVVTAAPDHIPEPLIAQLKPGGRLVIPVGPMFDVQQLQLIEKDVAGQTHTKTVATVAFVPLRRGGQANPGAGNRGCVSPTLLTPVAGPSPPESGRAPTDRFLLAEPKPDATCGSGVTLYN